MVLISLVPTLVLMVFYVSTFQRMCALTNMAVFCSSRTYCYYYYYYYYYWHDGLDGQESENGVMYLSYSGSFLTEG